MKRLGRATLFGLAVLGSCVLALFAIEKSESNSSSFEKLSAPDKASEHSLTDRAFFGAPPPMPHFKVTQKECLNCHAPKRDIAKRWRDIAPMPHGILSQCYQCHVAVSREEIDSLVQTDYAGLAYPGKLSRAHEYAPPVVPHKIFMRENCLSCHGETGISRIRPEHTHRTQCLQCHVPQASADYTRPSE